MLRDWGKAIRESRKQRNAITDKIKNIMASNNGWIGVDLDGTLAMYDHWRGVDHIGEPIKPMVDRVKAWLADGKRVKIFTARVWQQGMYADGKLIDAVTPIEIWCKTHIGQVLEVTNVKDFGMIALWDDRAVQVITNTGEPIAHCMSTL